VLWRPVPNRGRRSALLLSWVGVSDVVAALQINTSSGAVVCGTAGAASIYIQLPQRRAHVRQISEGN